jgi:hypothetical protein
VDQLVLVVWTCYCPKGHLEHYHYQCRFYGTGKPNGSDIVQVIFDSEVNAMQDVQTGKWSVFRLVWQRGEMLPERIDIATDLEREEVDRWLTWGNLSKSDSSL